MGVESVIILGKGKSALRCTKEYVLSFDKIAICNYPVIKDYSDNFPYKADWQYRNKSCLDFNKKTFDELGISKIIYTGNDSKIKLTGSNNHTSKVEYPDIYNYCMRRWNLDPSTGTQAFIDCVQKGIKKITMVGFDLFEVSKDVYFFDKNEAPSNIKYLWGKHYDKNNKILTKSGHNTEKTFKAMVDIIKENQNIMFELYTNYEPFKDVQLKNLEIK